jgi:translation initiation factor IF-2
MENVSQPKVFELAKEIGMETLALMDKIRDWKLPVRSHMAELDPSMLEQIRAKLKDESGQKPGKGVKKKKVAAAKVPAAESAGEKAAQSASPAKSAKPAASKAMVSKTSAPSKAAPSKPVAFKKASSVKKSTGVAAHPDEVSSEAGKSKVVVKKAAAKVVIRRKQDEEVEAAEAESAMEAAVEFVEESEVDEIIESRGVEEPTHVVETTESEPEAETEEPEIVADHVVSVGSTDVGVVSEPVGEAVVPLVPPVPSVPSVPLVATPTPHETHSMPAVHAPSRKREVVMTSQGPTSGIRSEAPRRNIVGRMDLSRVQPPQGTRPAGSGGGGGPVGVGGPSTGPGPRGMGPRPLRTGFIASAPVELPTEDAESRRRFDDKKARAKPGLGGGPGLGSGTREKEKEEGVADFSATEFRKREMVFQPRKKKGSLSREAKQTQITTPKASKRIVKVNQRLRLSELAVELGVKAGQLTKSLMTQGVTATMNTDLDFDTIALIVPEFGFEAVNVHKTVDEMLDSTAFGQLDAEQVIRSPVVTIMGHVDHGKTSLLDAIRNARVAAGEAGGITQHIGAYQVTTNEGHLITFIDTPGHEAFTAMRARGANATDIAVIVVAADDGVMPQTIEAVSHAKAAGVPIIVALNKMDKQGANPDRVKQQLTEQQLVPEEWGGDTMYVPVSALTKNGLPELLAQIHLVAEVEELKANPKRSATGLVIESRMDKGRGPVATLLVQDGTLEIGQSLVVGSVAGRVRMLINDRGERVKSAGPSVPVEVLGLSEVPQAGDRFDVTVDEKAAADIAATRKATAAAADIKGKVSLEDLFLKLKAGDVKELAIVLKSDVAGSSEAIKGMLEKVGTSEVKVKLIHSAVGGVNESDVLLASTAKGVVVGFNVRPDSGALAAAKRLGVEIKTYTIVYEMVDDLKKALAGLLAPDIVEKQLGRAEVRNIFTVPKIGTIAGSFVADGKIARNAEVRLVREGKIIYTGKLGSLKRFKDDAKEVAQGYECGIGIENFNDVKVGDMIEAFVKESIVREL